MRLYFDLKNKRYTLPDVYGVEVADFAEAQQVALEMIRTLRAEDPAAAQDWSGWQISVVDETGAVVFTLDLDRVA